MSRAEEQAMPTIRLGDYSVSRLIVGANPVLGFSYMGGLVAKFMNDYFTLERTVDLIERCLDAGINTWQTSANEKIDQTLERLREAGRDIQWIFLASTPHVEDERLLQETVRRHRPIAIVHHGGVSDRLWREGKIDQAHDFAKRVQDLGILAGISAHNPDVIRHAEDSGWNLDLYMACFYRLTRTQEEIQAAVGNEVPIWGNFLPGDPARMCEAIRQVDRPCLAFKILAGGRLADQPDGTERAFDLAFRSIKPTDAVIVGMFPRFADHPAHDAALTRRFASPSP